MNRLGGTLCGLKGISMSFTGFQTFRTGPPDVRKRRRLLAIAASCAMVLLLTVTFVEAESPTIDELEKRLEHTNGSERLEVLNELANGLCQRSTDTAVTYGLEAAELAQQLGDRGAEGYAFKSVGIAYAVAGDQEESLRYSGRALAIFEAEDNLVQMGKVLNNMGISYRMLGDVDQAVEYYTRSMAVEEQLDNPRGMARTLGNIANVYLDQSRYEEALETNFRVLEIDREIDDQALIASTLNNIGTIYFEQGRYQEALSFQLQALEIHEAAGDNLGAAGNYYNIANIKADLGQDDEALEMYEKALAAAEEIGDLVFFGSAHSGIGNLLTGRSDHRAALGHYKIALEAYEKAGHRSGIADAFDNLGICERAFGNLEQALAYHRDSLKIREAIGGRRAIANTCNNIGRLLTELGRLGEAEPFLKRGLEIATEIEAREIIRDATWHLSRLEKARGNYKNALAFLEDHEKVKDQLLNEFTRDAIARAEAQFESQKRDQEIILLHKENEIHRLEASRARLRTNLLLTALVLASGGLLWLFRRYRNLFSFWKRRSFVGHYKIIDQIAGGGMGVVYRAESIVGDSGPIALKVIREEYAADEIVRKRFLHEAAIIDQLNHPHIVTVLERGEHQGKLFMAMELLDGPSLAEMIHGDPAGLSLADCLHIMRQLIDVVSVIHLKGVLHRDLKPENVVLIERDGDARFVKLLDFGLARTQSLTRLTQSGMFVGTLGYLAPELITEQNWSTATDIYALGVVFYELLTRKPVFPGETPVVIIKQILEGSPVPPRDYLPDISPWLNDLILAMMAKDPGARPDGSAILAELDRNEV